MSYVNVCINASSSSFEGGECISFLLELNKKRIQDLLQKISLANELCEEHFQLNNLGFSTPFPVHMCEVDDGVQEHDELLFLSQEDMNALMDDSLSGFNMIQTAYVTLKVYPTEILLEGMPRHLTHTFESDYLHKDDLVNLLEHLG